jgi:hypothetical protein
MPDITAYAKLFRDWEGLIGACNQNLDLLPGVEPVMDDLEATLTDAKEAKIRQEHFTGERQLATQRFTVLVDQGLERARMLRGFIVSRLGSRSEKLPQFGIKPNRFGSRRANRPKPGTPPTPPPDNPPGPEVEAAKPVEPAKPE